MIDVCGAPASELPEGFPFVLFGQRYDNVTFDDWLNEGRVLGVSSAFGAATIEPAFGFETPYGPGSRPPMTDFVCARISGIAPARTLIIEWRPHPLSWVFNSVMEHSPRLDGVAHYEVLLYEGSNVVEIRYGHATSVGESPARDLVLHPRIAYQGTYAFLPGVTEGTTVRFTPR